MPFRPRALGAALLTTLLLTSACTPAGGDGDLVDDWAALAAPAFQVSKAGDCLTGDLRAMYAKSYYRTTPVECAAEHTLDVVAVADLPDAAEPPGWDTDGSRAAHAACDKAVTEYVGGDWHTGALGIHVLLPSAEPWKGGLRAAVCSVFSLGDAYGSMRRHQGVLRGVLSGDAPAALRCQQQDGSAQLERGFHREITQLAPIDCAQPHDAEFVGLTRMPSGPKPSAETMDRLLGDGCWTRAAAFLALTESALSSRDDIAITFGTDVDGPWAAGDRVVRCFLIVPVASPVKGSLKGLGKRKLPV